MISNGLGDTVDLALIGATWDKDRARELGGLFPNALCSKSHTEPR